MRKIRRCWHWGENSRASDYRFTTVTPASHHRVIRRADLRGIAARTRVRVESSVSTDRVAADHRCAARTSGRAGGRRGSASRQGAIFEPGRDNCSCIPRFRPKRPTPFSLGQTPTALRVRCAIPWPTCRPAASFTIIDIGCGSGAGGLHAAESHGARRAHRCHPVRHQSQGASVQPDQCAAERDCQCPDDPERRLRSDQRGRRPHRLESALSRGSVGAALSTRRRRTGLRSVYSDRRRQHRSPVSGRPSVSLHRHARSSTAPIHFSQRCDLDWKHGIANTPTKRSTRMSSGRNSTARHTTVPTE